MRNWENRKSGIESRKDLKVDCLLDWGAALLRPYKSRKNSKEKPQSSQTRLALHQRGPQELAAWKAALQGMRGVGVSVLFGDAFGMAIETFDEVNVVRAFR